jgi:hypothetical protein
MSHLFDVDLMPPSLTRLYENLREGRTLVAHGKATLTLAEMGEYLRQAWSLQAHLEAVRDIIRNSRNTTLSPA